MIVPLSPETKAGFLPLAEKMFSESTLHHLGYNSTRVEQFADMAMVSPFWFLRVVVENDQVRGAMGGYLTKIIYSDAVLGVEEGIYVDRDLPFRAKAASELVRQFVDWCKDNGAVDVRTGVMAGIDNYAADVFYRRNGFKRIGTIYALKDRGES